MRQCKSWHSTVFIGSKSQPNKVHEVVFRGPEKGAFCPCKSYEYSAFPHNCRHIDEARDAGCFWHQQFSDEVLDKDNPNRCPKCGKETEVVMVGV